MSFLIRYSSKTLFVSSGGSQRPTLSFISRVGFVGGYVASILTHTPVKYKTAKIHLMVGVWNPWASVDPGERDHSALRDGYTLHFIACIFFFQGQQFSLISFLCKTTTKTKFFPTARLACWNKAHQRKVFNAQKATTIMISAARWRARRMLFLWVLDWMRPHVL